MNHLLALVLCYAGMTALCLALRRHRDQVFWRDAPRYRRRPWEPVLLRVLGLVLLGLAIVPCVQEQGVAVGVVIWCGFVSAGALLLTGLLAYRPVLAAALSVSVVPALLWAMLGG